MNRFTLGQRVWFSDKQNRIGAFENMPKSGLLIRIIYYSDTTKQIQMGTDFYYEVNTPLGILRKNDNNKDCFLEKYPNAVVIEGEWVADDYFFSLIDKAMSSIWKENDN